MAWMFERSIEYLYGYSVYISNDSLLTIAAVWFNIMLIISSIIAFTFCRPEVDKTSIHFDSFCGVWRFACDSFVNEMEVSIERVNINDPPIITSQRISNVDCSKNQFEYIKADRSIDLSWAALDIYWENIPCHLPRNSAMHHQRAAMC